MKEKKLIFIDIDGVLNNVNDGTSYLCYEPSSYGISNKNLAILKHILHRTSAKMVLSTSWRNHPADYEYPYQDMKFKSPLQSFIKKIGKNHFYEVDSIPHTHESTKYSDIIDFFKYLKTPIKKFVILDDQENQGLDKFDSFFKIDRLAGLTLNDAKQIIHYLNEGKRKC